MRRVLAGLYVVLLIGLMATTAPVDAQSTASVDPLVAYGRYVATMSDCAACHTKPGGRAFAGGLPIKSPVGTIYASNITPSKTHGIGDYSRNEFDRALRKGIRRDGANIYPAMPYTAYAKLGDHDTDALYAYFTKGVQPVEVTPPQTRLPFPANIRLSMAAWNLLFFDDDGFQPDPAQSAQWNRGKFLVEGPAHCTTCHTPRGYFMQEITSRGYTGGQVAAWYAPNITRDPVNGIGTWSRAELAGYLRTGVAREHGARAAGTMAEAVELSFQHLNDSDIDAMVTFIQSVPSARDAAASGPRFDRGAARSMVATTRGALDAELGPNRGAILFQGNCATCHAASGQGSRDGYFPSLFHSSTTGAKSSNLIATILNGVDRTIGGRQSYMPGFGGRPTDATQLGDTDAALVANYVLTEYGNFDARVTVSDVATIRNGGPTSSLILVARAGIGLAMFALLAGSLWYIAYHRRMRALGKSYEQ